MFRGKRFYWNQRKQRRRGSFGLEGLENRWLMSAAPGPLAIDPSTNTGPNPQDVFAASSESHHPGPARQSATSRTVAPASPPQAIDLPDNSA